MTSHIAQIRIAGLHGLQSLSATLSPGLNIVHGKNGVGKTTFLHVLASFAELDLDRFLWITFDTITVTMGDGAVVELKRYSGPSPVLQLFVNSTAMGDLTQEKPSTPAMRKVVSDVVGGRPVYLPAFRSILEAVSLRRRADVRRSPWQERAYEQMLERELQGADARRAGWHDPKELAEVTVMKTLQCREWFGEFVPTVRCPSLSEVAEKVSIELSEADYRLANSDVQVSSSVFVDVMAALKAEVSPTRDTEPAYQLAQRIRDLLERLPNSYKGLYGLVGTGDWATRDDDTISRILSVYEKALRTRIEAEQSAYARVETFRSSVNRFLEGKELEFVPDVRQRNSFRDRVKVRVGSRKMGLQALSSGERQVLTLLFSATHMSAVDGMLLIDEPELSLHVGWQRPLLRELMAQVGPRQVVVCTHAFEVAADHPEAVRDLVSEPWTARVEEPAQLELDHGGPEVET